jgi:membrane protease YdiL (CAAX protease family)
LTNNTEDSRSSNQLVAYFILAYLFSWSVGVPLALAHQGVIPPVLPPWTHYLVAYGPMLSALVVTAANRGPSGLKDLGRSMVRWARPSWWIMAFAPLIAGFLLVEILNLIAGDPIGLAELGTVNFLPTLGLWALPLWFFTFGLGEETGWRGFALPRLQEGRTALRATLILAFFWALWHLPQFFYVFEPIMAPGWAIGIFAGAVVLTWLYNSTRSVLIVSAWHASFNFMTASIADTGLLPALMSAFVIFWAVTLLKRTDPERLASI